MMTDKIILIVDDQHLNIKILENTLPDYKKLFATSGAMALTLAESDPPPDLILLDVIMPDMDGYEVCQRLKANPKTSEIPIIFVTGQTNADDETKGLQLGAVDYLIKPINPSVVQARVQTHLALQMKKRDLDKIIKIRTYQLKESLEIIKIREKDLTNIMTFAMDAIIGVNADGHVIHVNPATEQMFGYSNEELIGQNLNQFMLDQNSQMDMITRMEMAINNKKLIEFKGLKKDNSILDCEMSISSLPTHESTTYTCFVRDITERNRLLKSLEQAAQAAESANKAKSEFISNMSHEIRSPMNAIIGMTELVLNSQLTEDQKLNLEIVQAASQNLLEIINNILDFSKLEAQRLTLEQIPFDLRGQLEDRCMAMAILAHTKGLELYLDIASDIPESLHGDPLRLKQIIVNLINNAIKFTSQGEVVVLVKLAQVIPPVDEVRLFFSVSDTGIGIAAEQTNTIFKRFTQVDGSTTRKYGGTGLGLTISQHLVQLMGGEIGVTSQVGHGSQFHFTACFGVGQRTSSFPAQIKEKRRLRPGNAHLAGIKILLGDPNQTGRRIVKEMLTRFGATVETTENSQSLIDIWHRSIKTNQNFDLILLDHGLMPHPDTLLNQICHREENKAKILFLLPTLIQNADQPGASRFHGCHALKKPVKLFGLLNTIDRMLNRVTDAQETKKPPSSPNLGHSPLRILLVEDIEHNQKLATTLLQQAGHTITLANNGRECLQKLKTGDFDLLLMDMRMPEMDGFEATRHIRMGIDCGSCDPNIPIVACTSRAMREEEAECLAAGMNGYLRKPYHAEELLKAIEPFARKHSRSPRPARNPDAAPLIKPVENRACLQSISNSLLLEGAEHIRLLQSGLHEKRVDQVLKEVEWLKTTATNIGAIRLKTLIIRLKGTAEVHDWAESLEICANLELEFRKISNTLIK